MTIKSGKSLHDELDDVLFVPKKKPYVKVLIILFVLLIGIYAIVSRTTFIKEIFGKFFASNTSERVESSEQQTQYITVVPRTLCSKPGDEVYTDWFKIEGDEWKIKLTSERVDDSKLANTRLWYTTSDVSMFIEAVETRGDNSKSAYTEVGDGGAHGDDQKEKVVEQTAYGPGIFRLRILCWNTRYSVEVKDL